MNRRLAITLFVSLITLAGAACGPAPQNDVDPSEVVTEAQFRQDLLATVEAYNEANYAKFSAKWAPPIKAMISESSFLEFQRSTMERSGRFQDLLSVRPGETKRQDLVVWIARCRFEREVVDVKLGYLKNGGGIDAVVFLAATNP